MRLIDGNDRWCIAIWLRSRARVLVARAQIYTSTLSSSDDKCCGHDRQKRVLQSGMQIGFVVCSFDTPTVLCQWNVSYSNYNVYSGYFLVWCQNNNTDKKEWFSQNNHTSLCWIWSTVDYAVVYASDRHVGHGSQLSTQRVMGMTARGKHCFLH